MSLAFGVGVMVCPGLVIRDLGEEVVVLDPISGVAHVLSGDSVLVWRAVLSSASAEADPVGFEAIPRVTRLSAGTVEAVLAGMVEAGVVQLSGPGSARMVGRRGLLRGVGAVGGAGLVSVLLPAAAAMASGIGPQLTVSGMTGCSGQAPAHSFAVTVTLTGYAPNLMTVSVSAAGVAPDQASAPSTPLEENPPLSGTYVGTLTVTGAGAMGMLKVTASDSSAAYNPVATGRVRWSV